MSEYAIINGEKVSLDKFRYGQSLFLSSCTGLTALPDGLAVGGSLYLRYCTGLTALPDGLTVGRGLYLIGYTGLYLNGCTGLKHLCVGTDQRGYEFYSVKMTDGWKVIAGCRNFTAQQARKHWPEGTECRMLAEKCIATWENRSA